jgi:hypothetical protein
MHPERDWPWPERWEKARIVLIGVEQNWASGLRVPWWFGQTQQFGRKTRSGRGDCSANSSGFEEITAGQHNGGILPRGLQETVIKD